MAQIGSATASTSTVFNLDFLPEYLLVNSPSTGGQYINNLSVVTSGQQLMSITSEPRITALAKFDSGAVLNFPTAASLNQAAQYIKLSTGRINKATTITMANPDATTYPVYAASTNINNIARRAVEQSINPSANATFDNFEALFFSGANVLRAQITFANGFSDEFTVQELLGLYAKYHISDEFGALDGLVCIDADSGAGLISQVVLFTSSAGSTVVLKTDYVQL